MNRFGYGYRFGFVRNKPGTAPSEPPPTMQFNVPRNSQYVALIIDDF